MSKYKYSLYGYHAIEKADITINGITDSRDFRTKWLWQKYFVKMVVLYN